MNNAAKTLTQLYNEHTGKVSDKWTRYLVEYDLLLSPWRDRPIRLLEIGVQNGGGLEIWAEYFKNASRFVGCDIDPNCALLRFDDSRIEVVVGDANADDTQARIISQSPEFDLIFDDGSHFSVDVIRSFLRYFPTLVDGGLYVVEDLHTSYWQEFGGGLFHPYSSLTFFKLLVDIINSEHWGITREMADILGGFREKYGLDIKTEILRYIHSIQFVNSLCVIFKSSPMENNLGNRLVVGIKADVNPTVQSLNGGSNESIPQDSNIWSTRVRPPVEELLEREQQVGALTEKLSDREHQLDMLNRQLSERDQQVEALTGKLSDHEQLHQTLASRLIDRDQKVNELITQLAEIGQKLESLNGQLKEIYSSKAWRFAMALRRLREKLLPPGSRFERMTKKSVTTLVLLFRSPRTFSTNRDLALIRKSDLFDPAWYLTQYPDVKAEDIDPARHYLWYGGYEKRDPGPDFSSKKYYDLHPDIYKSKKNPLVHYLRYVRKEEKPLIRRMLIFIGSIFNGFFFLLKLNGIVILANYPYADREKDGYYQRIRSIDNLLRDRWRIYIENIYNPAQKNWYDKPAPLTIVIHQNCRWQKGRAKRLFAILCILRCRIMYVHSILSIDRISFLWNLSWIKKIVDLHGVVPEELLYQNDYRGAEYFNGIEKLTVKKAYRLVVVSEAMRDHMMKKYPDIPSGRFITLPIFQKLGIDQSEKPYIDGKPVIVYAGGLQKWQQVYKMIEAIQNTSDYYIYKFFCPAPQNALAMLSDDLRNKASIEIDSKPSKEIFTAYRACHYGFILRDSTIVNRVACPTKLIEYLSMGIVPIVDCEDIGDFKKMGMQYVHLDDLMKNCLPDESTRLIMAKVNFGVFKKILQQYQENLGSLLEIVGVNPHYKQGKPV